MASVSDFGIGRNIVRGGTTPYLLNSVLAGAYVGVAVVLLVSVTGPLVSAGSPFAKLIQGLISASR